MKNIRHGNKRSKKRAQRIRENRNFFGEWLQRRGLRSRVWPLSSDSYAIRLSDLIS